MAMKNFPYGVKYPRTANWYTSGSDWYQLSTWCTQTFGQGNWDYNNQYFMFEHESHMTWFRLRWS